MKQFLRYPYFLVLYIIFLLIFLLQPFDFYLPFRLSTNGIKWLVDTNGIEFYSTSLIRSFSSPERLYQDLTAGTGITIEAWISTTKMRQNGPARIISYSLNSMWGNFMIGQQYNNLAVRLRTTKTDLGGLKSLLFINNVFSSDSPEHIIVTFNSLQKNIYIDGKIRINASISKEKFSNWDPAYPLVLGNEPTGNRPWLGKFFLLAIYNQVLSDQEVLKNYRAGSIFDSTTASFNDRVRDGLVVIYFFTERKGDKIFDRSGRVPPLNLQIPREFQVNDKSFLSRSYNNYYIAPNKFKFFSQIIGNIAIFIPLGYLLHREFSGRYYIFPKSFFMALLLGSIFTLLIESAQYFLKSRDSSLDDVVTNVIGVTLGIFINMLWIAHMKSSKALL